MGLFNLGKRKSRKGESVTDDDLVYRLFIAAYNGLRDLAEQEIARGADINKKGPFGMTPLHVAAEAGKRDIVALLIQHGADVYAKNNSGHLAVYLATQSGHTDIVKLLLRIHSIGWDQKDSMSGVLSREEANAIVQVFSAFLGDYPKTISDENDLPFRKEVILSAFAVEIQHFEKMIDSAQGQQRARYLEHHNQLRYLAVSVRDFQPIDEIDKQEIAQIEGDPRSRMNPDELAADENRAFTTRQLSFILKYRKRASEESDRSGDYPYNYRAKE